MAEDEIYVRTLATFDTKFPADTVEWCPVEPYRNVLTCGTYELNKNEPNTKSTYRQGQILLLRITNGGELELLQQVCTSAILDMKWLHVTDIIETRILLAVVDSMGYLQIYQLKNDGKRIEFITKLKVNNEENVMALSLDWSRRNSPASDPIINTNILVSDSAGHISRFTWGEAGDLTKDFTWPAHKFHAWIVAFDYCNPLIFYSGGDDNRFLCFDSRTGSHPVVENKKHIAGVTSIHSKKFLLATGSYDQNVRLWDKRNFARPISTLCLDGGVWRLKWDPFTHQYLLAACMHNGFKIINHDILSSVVVNYKEHKGLSYGCDWSFLKQSDISNLNISNGDTLMSTCSYEDCLLKVSVIDFWPDKRIEEKDY
ncbi:PREDICTED: diphthamide biosynthesis protein 7 [Acromyrmex echinatior]|uniref:methylated diphthine methylhydrolase n=1 Tax=Acromyrmex echinatior TaxID=103372 RepID=F4WUM0_ACREC|nr:PREDICTED: diphthamide biosynthesis protein 7 [Acromyrmex echinatior]XP_011060076.1 PREDICTED: diphthamide biosynthesis protein 7 [Acromyrmex echinatior]EGI62101.1 WD repeat-containing protein 85 [Acromyrmex echinatior]